ncbi:MAG: gliding motility-associated C-terminal domain-containing protein [Bacteroidales bacterium]|nr:gliding motility-associated C-terminal domain-containing protein [Bacteroidales bacterium]
MKRLLFITALILACCGVSTAQLETIKWYFGLNAGLDFSTPEPKAEPNPNLMTLEGIATFCDTVGNLLFYTDGRTVWNREHRVMLNGDGLIGHPSSTESAIIVPCPKKAHIYYVFVVDAERGENGLSYSLVDMTLDGGLGGITDEKNIQIEQCVGEKVTAVRNYDNTGVWVLSRLDPGDEVVEYFIDENGLHTESRKTFKVSNFFIPEKLQGYDPNYAIGYMRVSPNGKKIACVMETSSSVSDENDVPCSFLEVFDFNPANGEVTHLLTYLVKPSDEDPVVTVYGVEFSNDASMLYFTSLNSIYQMDLSYDDVEKSKSSVVKIANLPYKLVENTWHLFNEQPYVLQRQAGALQLAINGKIYVAQSYYNYLGVINNPRGKGDACNFDSDGMFLGDDSYSLLGLPNFIPSFFLPPNFEIEDVCTNSDVTFGCTDERAVSSYKWKLTNMDGNIIAESSERSFSLKMEQSGKYRISLTVIVEGYEHSDYRIFEVYEPPVLNLGDDIQICSYDEAVIEPPAPDNDFTFNWSDGSEGVLHITKTAEIHGILHDVHTGCSTEDIINVVAVDPVEFTMPEAMEYCHGKTAELTAELNDKISSFTWQDDVENHDPHRIFGSPGDYTAKSVDVEGCEFSKTVKVVENPLPVIDFEGDNIICSNRQRTLDCGIADVNYLWNTGATTRTIIPDTAGRYKVTITDSKGCVSTDSIDMELKTLPLVALPPDTVMCIGNVLPLSVAWNDAYSYQWQDMSGGEEFIVEQPGTYSVVVNNYCGETRDEILVRYRYCGEFVFPNIITPNGDGINDFFKIKGLDEFVDGWSIDIYNREGRRVFHSDDYHNEWNAPDVKDGVYFYIFYKDGDRYNGNISVFH